MLSTRVGWCVSLTGRMKFRSGGKCASMSSIHVSKTSVCAASNVTRASWAGVEVLDGVAMTDPISNSRLCTTAKRSGSAASASGVVGGVGSSNCSLATPSAAFSSSVSPSASNIGSDFA